MNREGIRSWYRWLPIFVAVSVLLVPALVWSAEGPSTPGAKVLPVLQRGTVKLDASMIPRIVEELPVLKLTPVAAPEQYIHELLNKAAPAAGRLEKLDKIPDFHVARHDGKVIAFTHVQKGHFEISPLMDKLTPTKLTPASAVQQAQTVFRRPDIIPMDHTRFVTGAAMPLYGATYLRGTGGASTVKPGSRGTYLYSVAAHRYVGNYPVHGPGSRLSIAIGENQIIHGVKRTWQAGQTVRKVKPTLSAQEVVAAIKAQLEPLLAGGSATVHNVTVGYYDGNQSYMQPVFRFTATIHNVPSPGAKLNVPSHVIGYVPIVKGIEPVPILSATPKITPLTPTVLRPPHIVPIMVIPSVGRYVVRNDNPNWAANANEFWSGLSANGTFTDAQYYWAHPEYYTTNKNSVVNAMNIVLSEGHGDWWLFTTLQNCCDVVDITKVPGGYGTSAGGNLRFWAIHSCEVVPAPDDTANWPDIWWNIFQGLHGVVGYRTIMWIDDDVGYPFGLSLGLGMPFMSSWLSAAHGSSAYSPNDAAMICHGGHWPGDSCNYTGPNSIFCKPMGRPTAIAVCGHESDNVFNTEVLPPANCLSVFWYPD